MQAAREDSQRNVSLFCYFPFSVWLPSPSHSVHLNLTHDFSLIVVIIGLIMAMTLYITFHHFPPLLSKWLFFSEGGEIQEQNMHFHLDAGLHSVDFLLETQLALLRPPPETPHIQSVLYGTLWQLCGNLMCTILIFKRNIKACQTIRSHKPDPL